MLKKFGKEMSEIPNQTKKQIHLVSLMNWSVPILIIIKPNGSVQFPNKPTCPVKLGIAYECLL